MSIEVDIKTPMQEFGNFLVQEKNHRILFSGIFGIGKTTFLKMYFTNNDKYLPIHLFPINYSVTRNEDIFSLIKYDILYELLDKGAPLEKLDADLANALKSIDSKDFYKMFKSFIEMIPEIGKKITEIIKPLEDIIEVLNKKKDQIKVDDAERIDAFRASIEQNSSSIYEQDLYTELIIKLISGLKHQHKKEVVLIVDDLDRIDPEHIFRILNIFAAHFDSIYYDESQNNNKFGIDKVVLCCDIDNIRKIYSHRYGSNVEFSGYIDKFFSKDIFYFNNKVSLSNVLDAIISSILVGRKGRKMENLRSDYAYILNKILASAIHSNFINLRQLLNWYNKVVTYDHHIVTVLAGNKITDWELRIIGIFNLLTLIFQTPQNLIHVLENSIFQPINDYDEAPTPISELLLVAACDEHKFQNTADGYSYTSDNFLYKYNVHGYSTKILTIKPSNNSIGANSNELRFKELFLKAYKNFYNGFSRASREGG